MAKLLLKFDDQVLQEVSLSSGTITIGRQPDNILRIDNPAVSGYHAKVYFEGGHYVLEDAESFNGTYVNNQRISKVVLKEGDKALIGKHTLEFSDQWVYGSACTVDGQSQVAKPKAPKLDRTAFLDTAKGRELIALAVAASASSGSGGQTKGAASGQASAPAHQTIGTLTIIEGRTDQNYYVLTGRLTVIGKSKMAGIRLKRWFAPHVAASIYRADDGYYIAASGDNADVKVNDIMVEGGKKQLEPGNVIEVAGIKAVFGFCES
jgi:pSer/pThr/pTyr-binding forkhead associated (FHA) protein